MSQKFSERQIPMPTQEERLAALEQKFANFQQETAKNIQEIEENTTIMLGVIRSQGRDIRKIFERLETIDQRLDRLETIDQRLDRLETKFDEHTGLLTQILTRLPKAP